MQVRFLSLCAAVQLNTISRFTQNTIDQATIHRMYCTSSLAVQHGTSTYVCTHDAACEMPSAVPRGRVCWEHEGGVSQPLFSIPPIFFFRFTVFLLP